MNNFCRSIVENIHTPDSFKHSYINTQKTHTTPFYVQPGYKNNYYFNLWDEGSGNERKIACRYLKCITKFEVLFQVWSKISLIYKPYEFINWGYKTNHMLVYKIWSYYLVEVPYQVGPESAHEYSIQSIN